MDNPIPVQEPTVPSPITTLPVEPNSSSKSWMYLLIAFLVILGLGGTVAYLLLFNDKAADETGRDNRGTVTQTCTYNGTTYNEGESFDATDGCNICSCTEGEVVCTLTACEEDDEEEITSREVSFVLWQLDNSSKTWTFTMSLPDSYNYEVVTDENSYSKAVVEGEGIAMEISIPGYAVDYGYESVSFAGTNNQFGNFYRVVIQSSPGEFRYVTNYVEGESCQDGGIPAPCGGGWMMSETGDEYFVVTGMGDTGICDEIVRSIFVE